MYSGGELVVLVISNFLVAWLWFPWYSTASTVGSVAGSTRTFLVIKAAPFAAFALVFWVLRTWASHDVRDSVAYLFFYLALGGAWIPTFLGASKFLGFQARQDVIERRNSAALVVWLGALAGLAAAYAGANIGDGPGFEVVFFTGFLATGTLLGSWAIYEFIASVSEAVTVERSLSAALRLAALLVAAGSVCGRAAAGDWVDAGSAVRDFVDAAWPVPMVAAAFGSVERLLAPPASAAERHASSLALSGVVPGVLVVGAAWLWVLHLGRW